jgi:hypothetical protein
MIVRFSDTEEFLEELKHEVAEGGPVGRLVRVTLMRSATSHVPIQRLAVVATFRSVREEVVRLERYCGDLWDVTADEETWARGKLMRDRVLEGADELAVDVRSGMLEGEP